MNIEILAARLASLVPEMAHDCPTNNAEVIKKEILNEIQRGSERQYSDLEPIPNAPDGFLRSLRTPA